MGLGLPKTDEGIIEMYQYSSTFGVIVLDTKDGAGKDVYGTVNLDYGDYVWFEFRIEDDNTVTVSAQQSPLLCLEEFYSSLSESSWALFILGLCERREHCDQHISC